MPLTPKLPGELTQTQQALFAVDHIDGVAADLSESFTEEGLRKLEQDARRVYWNQVLQELQKTVNPEADIAAPCSSE